MGEALCKLIGVMIIICAVIYIAVLLLLVVFAIAALVAPPYGAYRWLRHLLTNRYTLSPSKRMQCLAVAVSCFCLPLFLLLSPIAPALIPCWLGVTLSLSAAALFLTIEAYRQSVWPHHKSIWQTWKDRARCHVHLFRTKRCLWQVRSGIHAKERTHGAFAREHDHLASLLPTLIHQDPAFLSAQRARWERELAQLTAEEMRTRLARLQGELTETPVSDPKSASLTLQAALARIEINHRALGDGHTVDWREQLAAKERLENQIGTLRTMHESLRVRIRDQMQQIRQARQERVFLV